MRQPQFAIRISERDTLIDAFRPDRRVCYPWGTDTPVNHGNQDPLETTRDSVLSFAGR